jgi:hypothetical protein
MIAFEKGFQCNWRLIFPRSIRATVHANPAKR